MGHRMPGDRKINFGLPPWGVRCRQTENGWIVSATTRSCAAPLPIAFMSFWSYLAFGCIFTSKSLKPFTPALAAVTVSLAVFSLFFWWVAFMGVLGKVEVRLNGDDGRVFTGFGPFGWSRRFKRSEIRSVFENNRDRDEPEIIMEGRKRIRFGSWLSNSRRQYMVEVLSRLLLE
jgi:hypothetical protein